jgi:hypothetical protein
MSLVSSLIAFGLRQAIGEGVEQVVQFIDARFADHSQVLPAALSRAVDRSWQALGVALAGDGFLDRVMVFAASGDDKGIRQQVRVFLEQATFLHGTPAEFRRACLEELQRLRKELAQPNRRPSAREIAKQATAFDRYTNPASMLAGATRAVELVADALRECYPNLAKLLRAPTPAGSPLLAATFCYFFRREVETNKELAHGLFFDNLQQLTASQATAFKEIDQALAALGNHVDEVLQQIGRIEVVVVETHNAVLDMHAELKRLSQLHLASIEQIQSLLLALQKGGSTTGQDSRLLESPAEAQQRSPELLQRVQELCQHQPDAPLIITGPKRTYTLLGVIAAGDVADVYLARGTASTGAEESSYIVKISRVLEGQTILERERRVYGRLLTSAGDTTYRKYLPTLAESFLAQDQKKNPRRVNVFIHEPGFYTLEQVHEQHPALDGRHLAWIFKRLLTALGFSHHQGIVHGAVLPCHVLLHAGNHGLQLVGWGQSVDTDRPLAAVATRFKDWYPPEVHKKQPASPQADLFLAARCFIYLAGGDPVQNRMPSTVPAPMQSFIRTCLLEGGKMRPDDAWKLLDEFDELLQRLYGPPSFRELKMS